MENTRIFAASFDEGETYFGNYDTIAEAVKDVPQLAKEIGEHLDEDSTFMIGISESPFRIDGESVDSEDIIQQMEENADCGGEAYFADEDPFFMDQWEYEELNAELAKTMVRYLHKKFPDEIDEDGNVIHCRALERASMFDMKGHFLYEGPYSKGELQLPKGWKVGDPEPDFI